MTPEERQEKEVIEYLKSQRLIDNRGEEIYVGSIVKTLMRRYDLMEKKEV